MIKMYLEVSVEINEIERRLVFYGRMLVVYSKCTYCYHYAFVNPDNVININ